MWALLGVHVSRCSEWSVFWCLETCAFSICKAFSILRLISRWSFHSSLCCSLTVTTERAQFSASQSHRRKIQIHCFLTFSCFEHLTNVLLCSDLFDRASWPEILDLCHFEARASLHFAAFSSHVFFLRKSCQQTNWLHSRRKGSVSGVLVALEFSFIQTAHEATFNWDFSSWILWCATRLIALSSILHTLWLSPIRQPVLQDGLSVLLALNGNLESAVLSVWARCQVLSRNSWFICGETSADGCAVQAMIGFSGLYASRPHVDDAKRYHPKTRKTAFVDVMVKKQKSPTSSVSQLALWKT